MIISKLSKNPKPDHWSDAEWRLRVELAAAIERLVNYYGMQHVLLETVVVSGHMDVTSAAAATVRRRGRSGWWWRSRGHGRGGGAAIEGRPRHHVPV